MPYKLCHSGLMLLTPLHTSRTGTCTCASHLHLTAPFRLPPLEQAVEFLARNFLRVVEEDLEGLSGLGAHCMADVLRCDALVRAASDGVGRLCCTEGVREGGGEGSLRGAKHQAAREACPCSFLCAAAVDLHMPPSQPIDCPACSTCSCWRPQPALAAWPYCCHCLRWLQVCGEKAVFDAVMLWAGYGRAVADANSVCRPMHDVEAVLPLVRFPLMSDAELQVIVLGGC